MNITDLIVELLENGQKVEIPGIGTLDSVVKDAYHDPKTRTYYPASRTIAYSNQTTGDNGIVKVLAERECISEDVAKQMWLNYVDALTDKMKRSGKHTLGRLGTLTCEGKKNFGFAMTEGLVLDAGNKGEVPLEEVNVYSHEGEEDPFAKYDEAQPEPAEVAEPAAKPEPVAEPAVASEPEPEPEPVAEPTAASEPEPEPVVAAEPEPEPAVASEPEPEPVAEPGQQPESNWKDELKQLDEMPVSAAAKAEDAKAAAKAEKERLKAEKKAEEERLRLEKLAEEERKRAEERIAKERAAAQKREEEERRKAEEEMRKAERRAEEERKKAEKEDEANRRKAEKEAEKERIKAEKKAAALAAVAARESAKAEQASRKEAEKQAAIEAALAEKQKREAEREAERIENERKKEAAAAAAKAEKERKKAEAAQRKEAAAAEKERLRQEKEAAKLAKKNKKLADELLPATSAAPKKEAKKEDGDGKKKRRVLPILLILLLIAVLGAGAYMLLSRGMIGGSQPQQASQTRHLTDVGAENSLTYNCDMIDYTEREIAQQRDMVVRFMDGYINSYLSDRNYSNARVPMKDRVRQYAEQRLGELLGPRFAVQRLISYNDYVYAIHERTLKGMYADSSRCKVQGELMNYRSLDDILYRMVDELGLQPDGAGAQKTADEVKKVKADEKKAIEKKKAQQQNGESPVYVYVEKGSKKGYDLIAGFYLNKSTAAKMTASLHEQGCDAYIIEFNDLYYVSMGSASSQTSADALLKHIKSWYDGDVVIKKW